MSDNLIERAYENGPRYRLLLSDVPPHDLIHALTVFLRKQFNGQPDWETIVFAGRQTWHLDQREVESMLGMVLAEQRDNPTAWGVVGWYLMMFWSKRQRVDSALVDGLLKSIELAQVPGYMPDGPICALGTIVASIEGQEARGLLAGKVILSATKATLCNAAKTHFDHIKKFQ